MPACTIPAKAEGAFAILCPTPSLCSLEAVKGVKVAKVGIRALAQKSVGGLLTPTLSWCLPLVWSFAQRIFSVYGSRRRVERARRLTYILAKILRLLSLLAQIMEDGGRVGSLAPRGLEVWVPRFVDVFFDTSVRIWVLMFFKHCLSVILKWGQKLDLISFW